VEAAKGIKDASKIAAFIAAVRSADTTIQNASETPHEPLFQGSA
jgi:phosphoribosylanthranilate isomerase